MKPSGREFYVFVIPSQTTLFSLENGSIHNLCIHGHNLCVHRHFQKMKFQKNCSLGCLHVICLTNSFHVAVRLFSNRSQMTSKCGKNKKVAHVTHGNMESFCFV